MRRTEGKSKNETTAGGAIWATTAAFALISGCGTWLGNPKNPDPGGEKPGGNSMLTLAITGEISSAAGLTAPDLVTVIGKDGSEQGALTLDQATLVLKEIKLKLTAADAHDRQRFSGPYIVDLLANAVTPDPGEIAVEAGTYKGIELKLAKLSKDDAEGIVANNSPIVENSIYLAGSFTPMDGQTKPFSLIFDLDEEFKLQGGPGFRGMSVDSDATNPIVIAFHIDRWFDLTSAEQDFGDVEGSSITLDKDVDDEAGKKLREAIKENIKSSAKFGKDENRDGKLGREEDSDDENDGESER